MANLDGTIVYGDTYTARAVPRPHPGGGPYQLCSLNVYDVKDYANNPDWPPIVSVELGDPMSIAQELIRMDLIVNQKLDPNGPKFRQRMTAIRKAMGVLLPGGVLTMNNQQNKAWTYMVDTRGSVELPHDATDADAVVAARKQAIERLQNDETAVIVWRED